MSIQQWIKGRAEVGDLQSASAAKSTYRTLYTQSYKRRIKTAQAKVNKI